MIERSRGLWSLCLRKEFNKPNLTFLSELRKQRKARWTQPNTRHAAWSPSYDAHNNREQDTFLSTRTSNSRGETGSTPVYVTCLNCVKHVSVITATLLAVLILFLNFCNFRNYDFFQNYKKYAFPKLRSKIVFSGRAYCFVRRKHG